MPALVEQALKTPPLVECESPMAISSPGAIIPCSGKSWCSMPPRPNSKKCVDPVLLCQATHFLGCVGRAHGGRGGQMVVDHIDPVWIPDRIDTQSLQGSQEVTGCGVNLAPDVVAGSTEARPACSARIFSAMVMPIGYAAPFAWPTLMSVRIRPSRMFHYVKLAGRYEERKLAKKVMSMLRSEEVPPCAIEKLDGYR